MNRISSCYLQNSSIFDLYLLLPTSDLKTSMMYGKKIHNEMLKGRINDGLSKTYYFSQICFIMDRSNTILAKTSKTNFTNKTAKTYFLAKPLKIHSPTKTTKLYFSTKPAKQTFRSNPQKRTHPLKPQNTLFYQNCKNLFSRQNHKNTFSRLTSKMHFSANATAKSTKSQFWPKPKTHFPIKTKRKLNFLSKPKMHFPTKIAKSFFQHSQKCIFPSKP